MSGYAYSAAAEDTCWNAALSLREFTYFDIAAAAHYEVKRAATIIRDWERNGIVEGIGKGEKRRLRFRLVDPDRFRPLHLRRAAGRKETTEGNMWTAMRALKASFTPKDIAIHASTEATGISEEAARSYCRTLMQSGHLVCIRKAVPGRRDAVYRLVCNSGPLPPRRRMMPVVHDANSGLITPLSGGLP